MQNEKVTSEALTAPDLPADAFILDPATYRVRGGKLEFTDSPASRKSRKWGYIILGIAAVQFLFFVLTARNFGGIAFAILFGLFLGGIGGILLRNGQQSGNLKKSSQPVAGELLSIEARLIEQTFKKKQLTSNLIIATYKFVNPDGTELNGTATFERNDLIGRRLPYRGTPVIILYKNPKTHTMC